MSVAPAITEGTEPTEGAPATPPPAAPAPADTTPRTFDQEAVNRLLAEERRGAVKKFQESDDWKNAQAALKKVGELEAANKSELEKAQDRAIQSEKTLEATTAQVRHYAVLSAFNTQAIAKGIPADRVGDAFRLVDSKAVEFNPETGEIKGIDALVDELVKTKPYLVQAARAAPNLNPGGNGQEPDPKAQNANWISRFRLT